MSSSEFGFRTRPDLAPSTKIKFTTEAHGLAAISKASAEDRKRAEQERLKEQAVALAQPHRQGRDDPRLAEPLGRFCAALWPNDDDYRHGAYNAGDDYARRVREARMALGLSGNGAPTTRLEGGNLTPEQIEARKDLALMRLETARSVLISVHRRAPSAMERLTFDQLEPWPCDHDMLVNGLYRLAVEFGFIKSDRNIASSRDGSRPLTRNQNHEKQHSDAAL